MLSVIWILVLSVVYFAFFKRLVVKPWVDKKAGAMRMSRRHGVARIPYRAMLSPLIRQAWHGPSQFEL
ncbi:hypothetical protein SH501x_003585 [Pirellulaceae bacterium SH501]